MIEEEYSISIQDLQKKFQKWFGKPIPADPPFPAEVDHSIGNPVPEDLLFPAKVDHSIGDPVPDDLPFLAKVDRSIGNPVPENLPRLAVADRLNYQTRRRNVDKTQKLIELLGFGFRGAVSLGSVVCVIIVILNLSFWGWYSDDWPNQIFVVFFATMLGFYIGLSKGCVYQQRQRLFCNGEL